MSGYIPVTPKNAQNMDVYLTPKSQEIFISNACVHTARPNEYNYNKMGHV